jgi:hypothetical protein
MSVSSDGSDDVMAARDGPRLVIADVSQDEAWLSAAEADAATLPDWR